MGTSYSDLSLSSLATTVNDEVDDDSDGYDGSLENDEDDDPSFLEEVDRVAAYHSGGDTNPSRSNRFGPWQDQVINRSDSPSPQPAEECKPKTSSWPPAYDIDAAMAIEQPDLVDSHCHLDFMHRRRYFSTWTAFKREHKDTFPKSFRGCVAVFCDPRTWNRYSPAKRFDHETDVVYTFGCHPHFADYFDLTSKYRLKELLEDKKTVALGEIGLDYSVRNSSDKLVQMNTFREQMKMALKLKLPVCLHIREADEDGIKVLEEVGVPSGYPMHLHCFSSSWSVCQQWLSRFPGCMIGLTPMVTMSWAKDVHEVARKIPLDKLLLETDAPYLLPSMLKDDPSYPLGNMSHPGLTIHTAAQIAVLREEPTSVQQILAATRANAEKLYKLNFPDPKGDNKPNLPACAEDVRNPDGIAGAEGGLGATAGATAGAQDELSTEPEGDEFAPAGRDLVVAVDNETGGEPGAEATSVHIVAYVQEEDLDASWKGDDNHVRSGKSEVFHDFDCEERGELALTDHHESESEADSSSADGQAIGIWSKAEVRKIAQGRDDAIALYEQGVRGGGQVEIIRATCAGESHTSESD